MINSEDYHHIITHHQLINTNWCVIKAVVSADTKMGAIADSTVLVLVLVLLSTLYLTSHSLLPSLRC
jgi:hypothetical protein